MPIRTGLSGQANNCGRCAYGYTKDDVPVKPHFCTARTGRHILARLHEHSSQLAIPRYKAAIWLHDHWQSLSLMLVLVYLACRIIGFAQKKATPPGDVHDQTVRECHPVCTENELEEYDKSLEMLLSLRVDALNAAAKLPVPDAVYQIVTYNSSASLPFKIEHGELAWLTSIEQFEERARRANKLRHAAYHVGDVGMRRDGTYDAARDEFIAANPGFSDDTYKRAISYGYFMAR